MSCKLAHQTHQELSPEKNIMMKPLPSPVIQTTLQTIMNQEPSPPPPSSLPVTPSRERTVSGVWEPDDEEVRALTMSHFQVIGVLGVGTYGVVKLAKHIASGASVALKVLSKEHIVSTRQEKHILRERTVHLRLHHPFVARLYGTFQDDDCLYLVIEYLPGGELWSLVYSQFDIAENDEQDAVSGQIQGQDEEQIITTSNSGETYTALPLSSSSKFIEARDCEEAIAASPTLNERKIKKSKSLSIIISPIDDNSPPISPISQYQVRPQSPAVMALDANSRGLLRNKFGGLKEDHAAFYLGCILCALEYLHEQDIIYRDLKLENLVLDRKGYPKVLDFGFAKCNAAKSARNMTLCGSMDYMAPEILLHEPHDKRVDIWSFGIIMYEMLLGKTPFYHDNPRELGRRITSDPVTFPNDFEEEHALACDLISKLLVKAPEQRIKSMTEMKSHGFFMRIFPTAHSWERLMRKQRAVPFVPKLAGPFDTSFFETIGENEQDELDDYVQQYFEDGSNIFSEF